MSFKIDRKAPLDQNALERWAETVWETLTLLWGLSLSLCTHGWANMTFIMSTLSVGPRAHMCVSMVYTSVIQTSALFQWVLSHYWLLIIAYSAGNISAHKRKDDISRWFRQAIMMSSGIRRTFWCFTLSSALWLC